MKKPFFAALTLAVAGATGWAQTKTPATPAKKAPAKAAAASEFNQALLNPARLAAKAPDTYEAKFTTTKGDFVIKVTREMAPLGADRFYNLVKNGFYNGASFFRVAKGFVVQFGISSYPPVAAAWKDTRIKDDAVKGSNQKGFVSFATGGPETRTTQVFINLRDNSRHDNMGFSPFGEVTQGMEVVEQLYSDYGDGPPFGPGPDQGRIESEGTKYLTANFPKLDSIKTAVIISGAAPAAGTPAKKAPAKKASAKSS